MEDTTTGKSKRKRLQRQLEFYLSESNLRQDKFLQQAMDDNGFVPAHVFLSFNKYVHPCVFCLTALIVMPCVRCAG